MNLPNLYKTDSKNNVRVWNVKVEEKNDKVYLVTSSGIKNMKLIPVVKEITEGKGKLKDLPLLYAKQLAERRWKQQKERGSYSEDLNKKIITPMLAHNFNETNKNGKYVKKKWIKFPCAIQPKLDGIRCLAGQNNLTSRKNMIFHHLTHIENAVKKLNLPEHIYLDGELYNHNILLQNICSLVKQKNKRPENVENIQYHIYDCINLQKPNWSFKERFDYLKSLNLSSPLFLTKTDIIKNNDDVIVNHKTYVKNNYEGAILRNLDGIYKIGHRSNDLQKYKQFEDDEYKIVNFKEGENEKGCVIWECITEHGKLFNVRPKGTIEERKKMFENGKNFIGKLLTVRYYGKTSDNIPCFPVGITIRDYE